MAALERQLGDVTTIAIAIVIVIIVVIVNALLQQLTMSAQFSRAYEPRITATIHDRRHG